MKINRRKILSMLGMSPALLAGASADAQQEAPLATRHASGNAGAAKTAAGTGRTSKQTLVALNPKGSPPQIQLIPMAPRLDTLDGKTVYLVDTGFEGGGMLLHQIELWFNRNMPSVHVEFRRKAGPYFEDDPALWKEIKAKGNAAIMAIGH